MEPISWNDFAKVDFRVGEIVEAAKVEDSEKLIRLKVDFGDMGQKLVFSGIYKWYKPEELLGKKTVFVVNMVPKKIMDEVSEAMIFAAEDEEENKMSILILDREIRNGTKVF